MQQKICATVNFKTVKKDNNNSLGKYVLSLCERQHFLFTQEKDISN